MYPVSSEVLENSSFHLDHSNILLSKHFSNCPQLTILDLFILSWQLSLEHNAIASQNNLVFDFSTHQTHFLGAFYEVIPYHNLSYINMSQSDVKYVFSNLVTIMV